MRVLALAGEKVCQRFLFYLYQTEECAEAHSLLHAKIRKIREKNI